MEEKPVKIRTPIPPVGGWLLFFCVAMTILGPLVSIGRLSLGWENADAIFAHIPSLKTIMYVETFGIALLVLYGFVVGCKIWRGDPDGKQLAKQYLKIRFFGFIGLWTVVILLMFRLPSHMPRIVEIIRSETVEGIIKGVFREGIFFLVWWSYFKKSKRVRNTYDSNSLVQISERNVEKGGMKQGRWLEKQNIQNRVQAAKSIGNSNERNVSSASIQHERKGNISSKSNDSEETQFLLSEAELQRTVYSLLLKEKKDEATMLQAKVECAGDTEKAEIKYYQLRYEQIIESGEINEIVDRILSEKVKETRSEQKREGFIKEGVSPEKADGVNRWVRVVLVIVLVLALIGIFLAIFIPQHATNRKSPPSPREHSGNHEKPSARTLSPFIYRCVDNNGSVMFSTTRGTGCVLLPEFNDNPTHPKWVGQKMDFEFNNTDIKNILRLLSEVTGRKIVWGNSVNGLISCELYGVPWDQALEVMLKPIGLTYYTKNEELFVVQSSNSAYSDETTKRIDSNVSSKPEHFRPSARSNVSERDREGFDYRFDKEDEGKGAIKLSLYLSSFKNTNGIVKDTRTGLEWIASPDENITWYEARSWVQSISGEGWRMPTMDELEGLYMVGAGSRNMTPLLKTSGWFVWSGETEDSEASYFFYHSGSRNHDNRHHFRSLRAFAVRSRGDG